MPKSSSSACGRVWSTGRHERRESTNGASEVDGVLLVVLREQEHAGLPLERRAVRETHRAFGADATRTSCVNWKLSSLLLRVISGSGV